MRSFLISGAFIVGLFIVIFVFHVLATLEGWYVSIPWVDNIHHFLGGIWIAAVFFVILKNRPKLFDIRKSFLVSFVFVLGFVALSGIIWEFFEFGLERYAETVTVVSEKMRLKDTLGDLFFDLLGGLALAIFYLKFGRNRRN